MKILVLGGTGFIGRNMVEYFSADHEVHAVYNRRLPYDGPVWHKADLRQPFDFTGYDVVIHAAATTSGSKDIVNNPAIHVTNNAVMGSYIFRAAVEAKVKHVVFFSCTTMFKEGEIKEDSPIDIHPKYFGVAHTKLYLEKLCEFYNGETKFTAIRHSNAYGPYDKFDLEKSHFFGATITKVMNARDKVVVWGTGEESRDLLYVSDLCDFVGAVIEKGTTGVYNCGYGVALKVKDVVAKVIEATKKDLVIEHDLTAPSIPISLWLNCDKARNDLGWWPKVTLNDGIKKTLCHFMQGRKS